MKKRFLNNLTFIHVVRWWLTCILLILPFHFTIYKIIKSWNNDLSILFNLLDEVTLVIFLPLAIIEFYKNKEISNWPYIVLLFSIFILCISGFISGVLNGNSLLITGHGIFHYIKYFLVIFIYAAFIRDFDEFKKIFRLLLIVAVCIGFISFIDEVFALYMRYIFDKDVNGNGMAILINKIAGAFDIKFTSHRWRFGFYRASFLMHYNVLGLYCLFILTFYLHTIKKVNYVILFSLLTGVFVSISRSVYLGFALLLGLQIFKGRKWFIIFLAPCLIVLFFMSPLSNSIKSGLIDKIEYNDRITYRELARQKATEVWKDHPVWGVGPGMFGGAVAHKYRSPVYEEYNFTYIFSRFQSLDQFWPQVLAEMGITGTAAFAGLLVSLLSIFIISRQQTTSIEIKGLFTGLATYTIIFFIYTFGANLNNISILFPFSAFAGMALGCRESVSKIRK